MKIKSVLIFILLIILNCFLWAGTTGKIAGTVQDAESGEALVGVNVYIENSTLGGASNIDGEYFILNVPPGKYTLVAEYIGYAPFKATNVEVNIDLTTQVNVKMQSDVIVTESVIVVADRPIVTPDVSNSMLNLDSDVIDELPVTTIPEALALQAGIENGSRGPVIRGSSARETVFMVDGFSQNDERGNYPNTALSLSSIEEVQVQTGGFNAEYGQARSGLINAITKEGSTQKYNGVINFRMSPPAPKHFGPSLYSRNSFFNRPYLDPDVMWTGTNNGAWDEYTRAQYPNFEGWNAVSDALLADDNPDNDLSPEGAKRLFEWYHRRNGSIRKPDYVGDAGIGGPVPFAQELGNMRFYLSHFREQDMFIFPLSRDSYGSNNTQLKLTSDLNKSMKLNVLSQYSEIFSVSPYQWTTTPTGYVLKNQSEIANLTNYSNTGTAIPYMPGYFSPTNIYRSSFGLKLTHTLSTQSFYEGKIQFKTANYNTFKTRDRDLNARYEIVPGYFVDEAPYGYYGSGLTGVAGVHLGGWMNLGRDKSENSTFSLNFDYTSQIDPRNQLKAGLEFVYNDYNIRSFTFSPTMSTWTRSMVYDVFPYRLGVYLQDKLEYEGFIANVGLRMDYSDANSKIYQLEAYDDFLGAGQGNLIEQQADANDSKAHFYISPRLGVSHPITENSKLYFNYGHFVAEAQSSHRFRLQREANGQVTFIGNPNLEFEKTIAYEVGYEHDLLDMFLLKVAGYYKDVSNQAGWVYYEDVNSQVFYNKMENNNYADIRGVELTLNKRLGRYITGFINYTYDVRTSGYFGLLENYENPTKQRDYIRENPAQAKPRPRPFARANISFHTPQDYGPDFLGFKALEKWNLNILADWKTGVYETYNPNNLPGVIYNVQWRDWQNVNLRLAKTIDLENYSIQFYMDVYNLFNFKYMSNAGFSDNFDRLNYLESLRFSWEEGDQKGNDKIGDYRPVGVEYDPLEPNPDNDPEIEKRNKKRIDNKSYIDMPNIKSLTFLNPRDFFFGIRISF